MHPACHVLLNKTETFEVIAVIENASTILDQASCLAGVANLEDITALLFQRLFPEDLNHD